MSESSTYSEVTVNTTKDEEDRDTAEAREQLKPSVGKGDPTQEEPGREGETGAEGDGT